MNSLALWLKPGSVAHALMVLSLVAALGLFIGRTRIFKVKVGIIGVLFAGLLFGHFGFEINHEILEFVREFGLILFVYTIGMQVGPGFFNSFRQQGGKILGLGAGVVLFGSLVTWAIMRWSGVPALAAVGLYSGAVTNTPSLGAAQQILKDVPGLAPEIAKLPGLGYALAYPFGILGVILVMLGLRGLFRISVRREAEDLDAQQASQRSKLTTINLEVANPNLEGRTLGEIPTLQSSGVVISRIRQGERLSVARADLPLHQGDILLAVGPVEELKKLQLIVGRESHVDLRDLPSQISAQRVTVTETSAVGRSLAELNLPHRYGVALTRVLRFEVELAATPELRLQFGDKVLVVGDPDGIAKATQELGNSMARMNQPPVLPVFIGLILGVAVGMLPIPVPGASVPLKLGLAGGPLIVAMLLARWGKVGPVVWYMPVTASFMLRELGIVLFLSCVGLKAGDRFVETLLGGGWVWMLWAALITVVPLIIGGVIARAVYRMNYLSICGFLAGSMTDPPALAFAGSLASSDAPAISYATVYPLVMLLRVLSAQILVLLALR